VLWRFVCLVYYSGHFGKRKASVWCLFVPSLCPLGAQCICIRFTYVVLFTEESVKNGLVSVRSSVHFLLQTRPACVSALLSDGRNFFLIFSGVLQSPYHCDLLLKSLTDGLRQFITLSVCVHYCVQHYGRDCASRGSFCRSWDLHTTVSSYCLVHWHVNLYENYFFHGFVFWNLFSSWINCHVWLTLISLVCLVISRWDYKSVFVVFSFVSLHAYNRSVILPTRSTSLGTDFSMTLYTVSQKKTRHQTLAHNFPKC